MNNIFVTTQLQDPIPEVVHKFKHDSLVLSCATFNKPDKFSYISHPSLDTDEALDAADYELAQQIFDHYAKQIMWAKLNGKIITKFKEDLATYLYSDRTVVSESFIGLLVRLPHFYKIDKEYDEIKKESSTIVPSGYRVAQSPVKLKFFKTTVNQLKRTKNISEMEYWFHDQEKRPYAIKLGKNNPLIDVWNKLLETNPEICVSGTTYTKHCNDFVHYVFSSWKMESA